MKHSLGRSHLVFALISLSTSSLLVGCAGPRMVAPQDVASSSRVLEVQNRKNATGAFVNESFDLGSWKITDVDRDWKKKSSFSAGGYGASKTKTGYSFVLEAGQKWSGACASLKKEKGGGVGGFQMSFGDSTVVCECQAGDESIVATLTGKNAKKHDQGQVKWHDQTMSMAIVDEATGSNFTGEPAGYRVDRDGSPVGAVELLHPGRVWLENSLDEASSEALTCVFAGLMLYVPPED